jgi:hypothetical protein
MRKEAVLEVTKTKEDILELLVSKTMDYISQREKEERYRSNGKDYKVIAGEKTIRNFINSKLVEQKLDDSSTCFFFIGEYKYAPEFWRVESDSQIKKIINYIVFKNMSL